MTGPSSLWPAVSSLPLIPSESAPFGPLNPLHEYIIAHAEDITLGNAVYALGIPFAPLGLQAFLLQHEGTRVWRGAVAVLGLALILRAWTGYRLIQPELNAFNNGLGVTYLHLMGKYVEFGLLRGPIVDPYTAKGRHWLVSVFDLCINSRWVGLGDVVLDDKPSRASKMNGTNGTKRTNETNGANGTNGTNGTNDTNGTDEMNGTNAMNGLPKGHMPGVNETNGPDGDVKVEVNGNGDAVDVVADVDQLRWLPMPTVRRTRSQATLRHARLTATHYLVLDTMLCLLRSLGKSTIGQPDAPPNATHIFIYKNVYTLLPRSTLLVPVHPWVVLLISELCIGIGVWQALSLGYHFFAMFCVGSGLYEVDAWEVNFFDQWWKADSLLELWGRGWHQIFRHHFLFYSALILRTLGLDPRGGLLLPLVFIQSGALHALGELGMSPAPDPSLIFLFFVGCGLGCAAEILFRSITGRRVRGWPGWIWTWTVTLTMASWAPQVWFDAGMGGSHLLPVSPWSPGSLIAEVIRGWVIDVKEATQ